MEGLERSRRGAALRGLLVLLGIRWVVMRPRASPALTCPCADCVYTLGYVCVPTEGMHAWVRVYDYRMHSVACGSQGSLHDGADSAGVVTESMQCGFKYTG